MRKSMTLLILCAMPFAAQAYVGPGAGLSLLGALWALVLALGTALVFVVAWPIRRLLRKRNQEVLSTDDIDIEADEAEALLREKADSRRSQQ